MLRTFLLCLVATSALGAWEGALKTTFALNPFAIGSSAFIEYPRTESEVISRRWEHKTRPQSPPGLEVLELWCPPTDYTTCVFLDDTGYIAGLQIALNVEKFTDSIYDWTAQGYTYWTTTNRDGETENYWTICQFFISAESLTRSPEERIAARDSSLMLQDTSIWVSSFNGTVLEISRNVSLLDTENDFTRQNCIPWMGLHYYYKMTADLECGQDTILPWFPLVDSEQLIGIGLIMIGKHDPGSGNRNWFEEPTSSAVRLIVPRGPECLYNLADTPGLVTLHTYYIRHPYLVTCIF